MDPLIGGSLISAGANIIGGIFGKNSAKKTNEANAAEAQKNRDWQEKMSNTAHQRQVEDMKKAGLNPLLSATGGKGAATGSGAQATMIDEGSAAANSANAVSRGVDAVTNMQNASTNKARQAMDALQTTSNIDVNTANANKTNAEAVNIEKQGRLIESQARLNEANARSAEGRRGFEARFYEKGNQLFDWADKTFVTPFVDTYRSASSDPSWHGGSGEHSARSVSLTDALMRKLMEKYDQSGFYRVPPPPPSAKTPEAKEAWNLIQQGKPLPKNASPKLIIQYDRYQDWR